MLKEAVYHKIDSEYIYPINEETLIIRVRVKKDDVKEVKLNYVCKYKFIFHKEKIKKIKMNKYSTDNLYDYYEIAIKYDVISLAYYFEFDDEKEKIKYGNYKFYKNSPRGDFDMFIFPYLAKKDVFTIPDWFKKSVIYHIFPDRFARSKDFIMNEKFSDWDEKVTPHTYLGGSIKGIIEKLDYLENLGINLIYLNPVFKSESTHKYDTVDYYEIDPDFGTKEEFKCMVKKIHEKGMKIVIDGVFNHTGDDFFAFKDICEKGEKSIYKNWYSVEEYPVKKSKSDNENIPNYKSFAYYYKMPKLIMEDEESIKYFIDVMIYWVRECDIDGWRLDVSDEVSHEFWKKAKIELKKIKPETVLIGEIWYESRAWLNGDQFDSVMNYLFYYAVLDYVAYENINAKEFSEKLGQIKGIYKKQAYENLCNLIDSHDTPRFLHHAKEKKWKLKIAAAIQFTYPGVPYIYYGDEVGITGGRDPDCRRGMVWEDEKQDKKLYEYYKKLIELRKNRKSLIYGEIKENFELLKENIFSYERIYEKEKTYVYVNTEKNKKKINIDKERKNLITGEKYKKGAIEIDAQTVLILE